jgi:biotin-(acetyl-CoA carboxylase) ligase
MLQSRIPNSRYEWWGDLKELEEEKTRFEQLLLNNVEHNVKIVRRWQKQQIALITARINELTARSYRR